MSEVFNQVANKALPLGGERNKLYICGVPIATEQ